eukprot:gnl/MRDRNA2_/MRDRNA2_150970_c0_seq1.p1 gnl/MRDRNA2_/MRDRNA2_150970_c0~~gnl/MRDRNA2_/MRDRNA2_150970_c0_seq1.p1  ORF type:complete len:359 (-),score=62.41 gnl/MRDRNA2_/MRDRNA2_150970_c0_seq1:196-1272(-)
MAYHWHTLACYCVALTLLLPCAEGRDAVLAGPMPRGGVASKSSDKMRQNPVEIYFQNKTFQSIAGDLHFLYSMPPNLKPGEKPKGLFLMLHGCQRSAVGFFRLPEEGAMSAAVLLRGYAVAAPDSPPADWQGQCWDVDKDAHKVVAALSSARAQLGLADSPLYGIGISTGGMLLASLVSSFHLPFNGVVFNAAPHSAEFFQKATPSWPRTAFVSESNDQWATPNAVKQAAAFLVHVGTSVRTWENGPHPLDDLPGLSPVLDVDRSALLDATQVIRKSGLIVKKLGPEGIVRDFLAPNAADQAFQIVLREPRFKNLLHGEYKSLREELHVMDGSHGPTSEHLEDVLDFILQEGESSPKK